MQGRRLAALAGAMAAITMCGDAWANDAGRAFEPRPLSTERFAVTEPTSENGQITGVPAADGVKIHVRTWLPEGPDGSPIEGVPTILLMTPYAAFETVNEVQPADLDDDEAGANAFGHWAPFARKYASRGYAVSVGILRGGTPTGGCYQYGGPIEVEDVARVIGYLGGDAPWSNGRVGMYGGSYDASAQLAVAASRYPGVSYLKAIVPMAGNTSMYDSQAFDGVALPASFNSSVTQSGAAMLPGYQGGEVMDLSCQPAIQAASVELELTGEYGPFWTERQYRAGAGNVRAATLMFQGFKDDTIFPIMPVGYFDRIPKSTPHKMIWGQWGHDLSTGSFPRGDWRQLVHAWFDRWLMDLPTEVETWPAVQVQDSDGQWRAEGDWPRTSGAVGQLALDHDGLGSTQPSGSTSYEEPGGEARFATEGLTRDLRLTGQMVADLWVELERPDGHVAVSLFDRAPDGREGHLTSGVRSARHLAPLTRNFFEQEFGVAPAVGFPVRVPVRLWPADQVVPAGHSLVVRVAGTTLPAGFPPTYPTSTPGKVRVLHDCASRQSVLRFRMPSSDLLNVRDPGEEGPVADNPAPAFATDGGLASGPVCGKDPVDPLKVLGVSPSRVTG